MYTKLEKIVPELIKSIESPEISEELKDLIKDLFWTQGGISEKKDQFARINGHYSYVPSDLTIFYEFMRKMSDIYKDKNSASIDFIDIGSGHGDKVFMARLFGFNSYGIEYTQETFYYSTKIFSSLFPFSIVRCHPNIEIYNDFVKRFEKFVTPKIPTKPTINLINGDAFELNLSKFDIIYTYVPIHNQKVYKDLCKKIKDEMKIGSFWYEAAPPARSDALCRFKSFSGIGRYKYLIQKTGENSFIEINYGRDKGV